MKTIIAISILISFSAFADFSDEHTGLCQTQEVKKLMGKSGNCQLALASVITTQVSNRCTGKLADISCQVMVLKSADSSSMTLICGDVDSPLVSQILEADILSYNVSAVVKTSAGDFKTINDPNEYHLLSNPALEVHLARGDTTKAKMILTLQDRSIPLSEVVCE
jgi:hypothetical protein